MYLHRLPGIESRDNLRRGLLKLFYGTYSVRMFRDADYLNAQCLFDRKSDCDVALSLNFVPAQDGFAQELARAVIPVSMRDTCLTAERLVALAQDIEVDDFFIEAPPTISKGGSYSAALGIKPVPVDAVSGLARLSVGTTGSGGVGAVSPIKVASSVDPQSPSKATTTGSRADTAAAAEKEDRAVSHGKLPSNGGNSEDGDGFVTVGNRQAPAVRGRGRGRGRGARGGGRGKGGGQRGDQHRRHDDSDSALAS